MFTTYGAWRQSLAAVICSVGVFTVANSFFWLSPLMQRLLTDEFRSPLTTSDTSWLVSIVSFGEILVTVPSGIISDKMGRKGVLLMMGPVLFLAWIIVLTTDSLAALFVVRLIQGTAVAVAFAIAPVYVAEVSDPRIRGRLSGIFQVMWSGGMLSTYLTGPYLTFQHYIWFCASLPAIFTVLFYLMPESPYYLLMRKRTDESRKALVWLRGREDVDSELESISKSVDEDMARKGGWKDLIATSHDRKIFFTVQLISGVKHLIGTPVVNIYASTTFAQASSTSGSEHMISVITGAVAVASAVVAAFMSDSIGRRPLLIMSTLLTTILNVVVALYFFLEHQTAYDVSDYAWIMYASITGTLVITNIGVGPLTQTIQAEMFPSHTRAIGGGVTGLTASLSTFLIMKEFQTVMDLVGIYLNFFIFAAVGLVGTVVMYIVLRETAGKSLADIQTEVVKTKVSKDPSAFPKDPAEILASDCDELSTKSV